MFKNADSFNEIISQIEKTRHISNGSIIKYVDYFLRVGAHDIMHPFLVSEFYEVGI